MKKKVIKILCIILAILLLITAVIVIGAGVMSSKGYGVTKGRCLITGAGSHMLIDENNSPIEMSSQTDKYLFTELSSGDEILIVHDGIQESYPARTGVYYCKKISDGKAEDIPASVIDSLTELGWLGNKNEGTRIECSSENYKFSLIIPDGWEYEKTVYDNGFILENPQLLLENPDGIGYEDSIVFWPKGQKDAQITVCYEKFFGVCGTGLESKTVYLGEHIGYMGTYDNEGKWSFITLETAEDFEGDYVIYNSCDASLYDDYDKEIMEILSTIEYN